MCKQIMSFSNRAVFLILSNLSNRAVLLILFLLFAGGSLWSLLINLTSAQANFAEWGESWLQNFSTEMFGAFLTFALFTMILGSRQEKERLFRQLRSKINMEAIRAAEEIREHDWLYDGSLQNAYLPQANLAGAIFAHAKLEGALFAEANLAGANLAGANLTSAFLTGANLAGANLTSAILTGAILTNVNLRGARLQHTELKNTFLPDGLGWTPDTDMARFTEPNHPEYWRPKHNENGSGLPWWYELDE